MTDESQRPPTAPTPKDEAPAAPWNPLRTVRIALGGVLMGIANLIPGVSGGTMILAVGLYEEFIDSVAELTALRFSVRRIAFLAVLGGAAGVAIVVLSKVILYLLLWHATAMFALFIGLTLGGTPLLWRMMGTVRTRAIVAAVAGFGLMAGIAALKELGDVNMPRNTAMDLVSGVVGSTTMVLPGISGSYMLLILDQYDRVIGAVAEVKEALSGDTISIVEPLKIIVPVGIGAMLGIVGLSNLLKFLLHRFEQVTLGFLLGMLLGSVLGLWPFDRKPTEKILEQPDATQLRAFAEREGVPGWEACADDEMVGHILDNWPERRSAPYAGGKIVLAVAMLVAGFVGTTALGRLGAKRDGPSPAA